MRTQTSCFNLTALRKDLTRFAPLWGLYTLALLCGLFLLTGDSQWGDWYLADNFISLSQFMPLVNLGYAFLAAAALFGDLFNARMCNGLHALPLRREGWFAVHTLSGLLFSLIPTAIMALASLPMMLQSGVENAWTLSLYFFAYSNLQFLFCFATAALAAQCVGNYVAMALMYLLINGGAGLAYILVDNLLTPLLYGVITPTDPFAFLSPVLYMVGKGHLFDVNWPSEQVSTYTFVLNDGWGYLLGCAALGVAVLVLACLLYRRRDLETAGDFAAIRWLNPVAAVCFALLGCGLFHFIFTLVRNFRGIPNYTMAFVGLITGWILGQMFLQRSTRVFRVRTMAGAAAMSALLGITLLVTMWDPMGIQHSQPDPDKIANIRITGNYRCTVVAEDPEKIAQVMRFQQLALEEDLTDDKWNKMEQDAIFAEEDTSGSKYDALWSAYIPNIKITYTLEDGTTIRRQYNISADGEAGQLLRQMTSTVDVVTEYTTSPNSTYSIVAKDPAHLMSYVQKPHAIRVNGSDVADTYLTEDTVRQMFEAILADCQDGTLSQLDPFHPAFFYGDQDYPSRTLTLYLQIGSDPDTQKELYVHFGLDSTHLMNWMASVGLTPTIRPAD